jgi:hypothetical protein
MNDSKSATENKATLLERLDRPTTRVQPTTTSRRQTKGNTNRNNNRSRKSTNNRKTTSKTSSSHYGVFGAIEQVLRREQESIGFAKLIRKN